MRYLPREDAPFSNKTWEMIDAAVLGAAKSQLAGRRVLEIVVPSGFGARIVENGERAADQKTTFSDAVATMSAVAPMPIPLLRSSFMLPIREVAAAEERTGQLWLDAAVNAGVACARLEEALIFRGDKALGVPGLTTAPGAASVKLGDWEQIGQPVDDLIKAASALDANGFPGPYAAALAPRLYNLLLRRYEHGHMSQLDHAREVISAGIVKAPALQSGGVVLVPQRAFAHLHIAQDMTVEFVGPAATDYEMVVLESVVPRVLLPQSICVLTEGK